MQGAEPRADGAILGDHAGAREDLARARAVLEARGERGVLPRLEREEARAGVAAGVEARAEASPVRAAPDGLTARELEVLRALGERAREQGDRRVALRERRDGPATRRERVRADFGARGRANATAYAMRHGSSVAGSPDTRGGRPA